jgi:antitoxin (DNA-binding transcriptional repressor) of toxin-antitoxin stability system
MIRVNIHDAKTNLSKYLSNLEKEGKIILCKHNIPIAEIVPIQPKSLIEKRPIGLAQGEFSVPESFYDELPEELVESFYPD